jgi:copper(I)-binding protein
MPRCPLPGTDIRPLEERLIMRRTLVPCGVAMALLAPLGHGQALATPEASTPANATILPVPASMSPLTIVAQSNQVQPHAGHGDMTSFTVGDLVVESPWARESVTPTGAAYFTVRNDGDQDDRLIGLSSEVADEAQLHSSVMQDGVMKMRPVEAVDVPARGEAVLEPGGLHVMLIGLKAPLEEGGSFPLTLDFENAGKVQVMTTIEDIGHGAGGHGHSN